MTEVTRTPVAVVGAAAITAHGLQWRGLGTAMRAGQLAPLAASTALANSHPDTPASEVPPFTREADAGDARTRRLMSRAAQLAGVAAREALLDATWTNEREPIGYFLGVGASGGRMKELEAMLRASVIEGTFSKTQFGKRGLRAANPLFAFQLMNNMTLCHSAILEGTRGPNAALYSRGGGTVMALDEALHAVANGECDRALAGGADSALHPVTWSELRRRGHAKGGFVPAEGAGLLCLAPLDARRNSDETPVLGIIESCKLVAGRRRSAAAAKTAAAAETVTKALHVSLQQAPPIDLVAIAPWGSTLRNLLCERVTAELPDATLLDVTAALGDSLAATPALAWVAAIDLLQTTNARRALILTAGIDGDIGAVVIARAPRGGPS